MMNHMKDVAKMLGVQFGEEFKIKYNDGSKTRRNHYLTENGLFSVGCETKAICSLFYLLVGEAEIIKLSERPMPLPILTEDEKEELTDAIKLFNKKVDFIWKTVAADDDSRECVCIRLYDDTIIILPDFEAGTEYENMNIGENYYLEELGL